MRAVARPAVACAAKSRASTAETIVVAAVSPLASANGIVVLGPTLAIKRVRVANSTQAGAFVTDASGTVLPVQVTVSSIGSDEHVYLLSVPAGKGLAVATLLFCTRTSSVTISWPTLAIPCSQRFVDWMRQ
jgi:hypothetical protein